uniref:Uncharacterized protein n=1 Tax=Rhizophora mucronata TaxID=61149 RepID=A0A2P2J470_RHIMU
MPIFNTALAFTSSRQIKDTYKQLPTLSSDQKTQTPLPNSL